MNKTLLKTRVVLRTVWVYTIVRKGGVVMKYHIRVADASDVNRIKKFILNLDAEARHYLFGSVHNDVLVELIENMFSADKLGISNYVLLFEERSHEDEQEHITGYVLLACVNKTQYELAIAVQKGYRHCGLHIGRLLMESAQAFVRTTLDASMIVMIVSPRNTPMRTLARKVKFIEMYTPRSCDEDYEFLWSCE